MTRFPCALLAATILIAACTPTTVDAPSLLPRANEKLSFDEPVAAPPAAVAPDPALDAAIAGAAKALVAAADRFAGDATRAETLIGAARDRKSTRLNSSH